MKKLVAIISSALLVVALAATVYITYRFNVGSWEHDGNVSCFYPGFDFLLRTNEARCLMSGVDPFKVWNQDVDLPPYYPYNKPALCDENHYEPLNAYCPWEYSLAIPLSLVPRKIMWPIYFGSMLACVAALLYFAYRKGEGVGRNWLDGALVSVVSLLAVVYSLYSNLFTGNYALHLLLALVLMAECLNRDKNVLAGFFWAFAMIKPNLAILMAIPLLLRKKWVTCVVAAVTCILLSIPAVVLCKTSFIELLSEVPSASADIFFGCGTMPSCFCALMPTNVCIVIGLGVGLVSCVWMTWMLKVERDWFLFVMPTVICSICWSFTSMHAHLLAWFFVVVVLVDGLRVRGKIEPTIFFLLVTIVASRVSRLAITAPQLLGERMPSWLNFKDETLHLIESLNSTLLLCLCFVYCYWRRKENKRIEVEYAH